MTVIDQTNDPGYATLRVLVDRFPALRDMAKTANIDEDEFTKLADDAFAWPSKRQFPVHTKEHSILSLGYAKLANEKLPVMVTTMLEKAATLYEIEGGVFKEAEIKEAADTYYLLPEKKRFLVSNKEDVKLAEQVLREKYAQLSVEDRAEAFVRLGNIAGAMDVGLSPSTYKLAGFTITSTRELKDWLEARKEASFGTKIAEAYEKLATAYTDVPEHLDDRVTQVKLAQTIHELDKEAGLTGLYGKKLPDPIQTVFNTEKLASEQTKIGSLGIDDATLASIPLSFWEDALGPDIAKEASLDGQTADPTLLKQILPTLPADLKAVVQTQLAPYR